MAPSIPVLTNSQRILILGCCGAGKSRLAAEVGRRLGLEVLHLDTYFWQAGWVEPDPETWGKTVEALLQQDAWVMDGNYGGTLPQRLAAADAVIYLDLPRWLCLWRVGKRMITFWGRSRPDMAAGCPEQFSWEFWLYVWNFAAQKRPKILRLLTQTVDKQVIVLRSPSAVQQFLTSLPVVTPASACL